MAPPPVKATPPPTQAGGGVAAFWEQGEADRAPARADGGVDAYWEAYREEHRPSAVEVVGRNLWAGLSKVSTDPFRLIQNNFLSDKTKGSAVDSLIRHTVEGSDMIRDRTAFTNKGINDSTLGGKFAKNMTSDSVTGLASSHVPNLPLYDTHDPLA